MDVDPHAGDTIRRLSRGAQAILTNTTGAWPTVPAMVPALADAATRNDVVTGLLGADAALGGLLLVFLGVVLAGYGAFGGDTPPSVLSRYKTSAGAILGVFALSLVGAALAIVWLMTGGDSDALYVLAVIACFVELVAVLAAALYTVYGVVFR
jgi:hypothetical protein